MKILCKPAPIVKENCPKSNCGYFAGYEVKDDKTKSSILKEVRLCPLCGTQLELS